MQLPQRKREVSVPPADDVSPKMVLRRSEELYMDDGNLIVAAKDVAFRVHRSILARHSEVFRDMFEVVSLPSDAEIYDGHPVVPLSDAPEDVLRLLCALYDTLKHMVDSVYAEVLEALSKTFPRSLEKWNMAGGAPLPARLLILQVAYETNAHILLPALFYGLCNDTVEAILRAKRDLPHHILTTYFRGKEKIATQIPEFVEDIIMDAANRDCCDLDWRSLGEETDALIRRDARSMTVDPLYTLDELSLYFDRTCEVCKADFRAKIAKKSREIWSSLPEFFGLISWEHLWRSSMHGSKVAKRDAIGVLELLENNDQPHHINIRISELKVLLEARRYYQSVRSHETIALWVIDPMKPIGWTY
ncbi:hypothetical protein JB92DRAFT_2831819 [Gautieria morchelliformis]|nr:hypothetical protein JB92DRAFT_2831819 [Gautieria morchelliformis]